MYKDLVDKLESRGLGVRQRDLEGLTRLVTAVRDTLQFIKGCFGLHCTESLKVSVSCVSLIER